MPVHDWTRVSAGTFHSFHLAWIAELRRALNAGILPDFLYAQAEQHAGDFVPDVLTLERLEPATEPPAATGEVSGGLALETAPPRLSISRESDPDEIYTSKRRSLVIRHTSGDRIVALIEIASPGNKDRYESVTAFVEKTVTATRSGYHLIVADLFPPRRYDEGGLCNAAFASMGGKCFELPRSKPLCVAAFRSTPPIVHCYDELLGLAMTLPDVPLFFDPDHYVNVPMESTYSAAWTAMPKRWRDVIEATA